MRSFKAAPEVLSAWMDERKLTAAELSRQTGHRRRDPPQDHDRP